MLGGALFIGIDMIAFLGDPSKFNLGSKLYGS